MSYKAKVRVTAKHPDTGKKYATSRDVEFYESLPEAVKDVGERNALDMVNKQVKKNAEDVMRPLLKAKITGEEASGGEAEEVEID